MKDEVEILNEELRTAEDSGFGQKFIGGAKLIDSNGSFNIVKKGVVKYTIYEYLLNCTWSKFFLWTFLGFLSVNAVFAILYYANGVENINLKLQVGNMEAYLYCLYFSVQTFTSVGYGYLSPLDHFSNILSSINAFAGLLGFALATGLLFARFSRARVNILFSKNILLTPFQDKKSIQWRIINENSNTLMDVKASATLSWVENIDGVMRRKFHRLPLELDFIYMFPLNWTLVHKITEDSPLHNKTLEELMHNKSEILVNIKGYDDTYGQFIYKNHSYTFDHLIENASFVPMYENEDNHTVLHIDKLDKYNLLKN